MSNKKIFMSVTASAVIASAFFAAEKAEAASHKVQSGDSLWKIAQKYNTTVVKLQDLNGLSGDIIFPNQIIETSKKQDEGSAVKPSKPVEKPEKDKGSGVAATYTVKRGDTLSGIASQYKISLNDLMKWNELESTLIFPGNKFVVSDPRVSDGGSAGSGSGVGSGSGSGADGSGSSADKDTADSSTVEDKVYRVKSGDTLSRIAILHGVTVANLKQWNKLSSDLILIGQKLKVGEQVEDSGKTPAPVEDVDYNIDKLIDTAHDVLGASYAWGGQTPAGFDCSGFIHYAYKAAGMDMVRHNTIGYYSRSHYVDKPQVGDLVFFENTYQSGISHVGIYIGNDEFIHAGSSSGVTVANVNDSYWKKHFDGYKRFY